MAWLIIYSDWQEGGTYMSKNKLQSPYKLIEELLGELKWYQRIYIKMCFVANNIHAYLWAKSINRKRRF